MKRSHIILISVLTLLLVFTLAACNHEHQYRTQVLKEPNCTEAGVSVDVCELCGDTTEEKEIPSLGHSFAKDDEGNDLWTKDADKHWHECTVCGDRPDEAPHELDSDKECAKCGFATFAYKQSGEGYILTKYNGKDADVVVPSTYKNKAVIGIDEQAFYQNTTLTSIAIPSSVKSIGRNAFLNCANLDTVKADSVTAWLGIKFANYAANPMCAAKKIFFGETEQGETLTIPTGVGKIGEYAFYGFGKLTSVTIPADVTEIGYRAFENAFDREKDLTVNITDLAKWCAIDFSLDKSDADKCGANPLYFGAALSLNGVPVEGDIELPSVIKAYAFYGYDRLTAVTSAAEEIGTYAFANCKNLRSATLNSLKIVAKGTFTGCEKLETISAAAATEIEAMAFANCDSLESITLPETLIKIGDKAFENCAKLASVNGADGLERVGEAAFAGTKLLGDSTGALYVGKVLAGFKGAMPAESNGELTVNAGTVAIADGALSNLSGLTSLKLPESLKYIGKNAVRYSGATRASLADVDLSHVEEIGAYAFAGNSALSRVQIPTTVKKIGENAFVGCSGLYGVYVEDIGSWLNIQFENAQANPVALAGTLYFGIYAPDTTLEAATSITIPDGTEKIGAYAFYGMTRISYVVLPAELTSVEIGAFEGCSALRNVYYKGTSKEQFDGVSVATNALNGTVYCFSQTRPETSPGNYWYYDDTTGAPMIWR